jgi:hypothetical protein
MKLKDDDIILLKLAHRFGPGEMNKIIDDAILRKDSDPLEDYYMLIAELKRYISYIEY